MLIPYTHYSPALAAPVRCAATAAVIGRTIAGPGLVLRDYATVRADGEWIRIGANAFFAERATVHIADSLLPAAIGSDVTVGRYALVHACTLGDRVVVGDAAVVMDAAVVGAGALIAAASLVPPRKTLAGGWVYEGNPATPVREIGAGELAEAAAAIRSGGASTLVREADLPPLDRAPGAPPGADTVGLYAIRGSAPRIARAYVAPTALIAGDVTIADAAGVYFGCAVVAGDGRIAIGPRSNVQDNSLLVTDAARGALRIGARVTVGHNVRIGAALIEDDALIGMGSQLSDGVVVEAGGCVGARAWVEPHTVVKAGWIWAGRPARPFREVKAAEREWFALACDVYVAYAAAYLG